MPIEIREIIIKTEIRTVVQDRRIIKKKEDFQVMRKQLLQECKRIIFEQTKKNIYKR